MAETLRIGTTDVILYDYEPGKGKIIISDDNYGYNFSYFWGAMGQGSNLREFLCRINSSYFVGKLSCRTQGDFDAKKTFANIRKYIREEMSYELPWYKHMEFQKDMRAELKDWERTCDSDNSFVNEWNQFMEYTLDYYLIEDKYDRDQTEKALKGIEEPWSFIRYETPKEHIWLENFHKKLQKFLNKK